MAGMLALLAVITHGVPSIGLKKESLLFLWRMQGHNRKAHYPHTIVIDVWTQRHAKKRMDAWDDSNRYIASSKRRHMHFFPNATYKKQAPPFQK